MTNATYKFSPVRPGPSTAPAQASLVFSWGDSVHAVALREGQSLVVGRSEPAQIILDDRSLSRTHARLSMRDGRVALQDLDSTNGSTINGHATREAFIGESDVVLLGAVELRLTGLHAPEPTPQWLSLAEWTERVACELVRARVLGRPFAIVAIRTLGGTMETLPIRPIDQLCHYAPRIVLALMPEALSSDLVVWTEAVRRSDAEAKALGAAIAPEHGGSAEELLARALEAARRAKFGGPVEVAKSRRERPNLAPEPVVRSPCMLRLYDVVARVARTTLPVLVFGETGSGKELVAQAVHQRSPRAKGPFKALNCATIPANLIESILFGHEKGAFSGADKQTPGIFEQAQGGTVFLDEIGELSERAQAALLRVLETRRVVRVGGVTEIDVDVRVVAATHRDLVSMVKNGSFREDLMFRLDALSLSVPPLRERREEIAELARAFLRRAQAEWASPVGDISDEALEVLELYRWPGNVRQLKNVIERSVVVCAQDCIQVQDLPEQLLAACGEASASGMAELTEAGAKASLSLPDRVREFEIGLIREAMNKARGNQAQAAKLLGVPRRTLAHKVQAFRLMRPDGTLAAGFTEETGEP